MDVDLVERKSLEIAQDYSIFMKVIESLMWKPYRWGGDDPSGFDCSGMVVEGLKRCGRLAENEDFTADGLWHTYYTKQIDNPRRGALIFKIDDSTEKAVHVGVCLNERHYMAAEGGGPHVKTEEDAWKYNAYIKPNPIKKIKNPKFVDPWD